MRARRKTAATQPAKPKTIKYRALRKPRIGAAAAPQASLRTPPAKQPERPRELSQMMTRDEVAASWHCSRNFVDKLLRKKAIPFYKMGHLVRFDRDELQAALKAGVR